MPRLSARWLLVAGVGLSALGVVFYYQLERRSFVGTDDWQFRFLQSAFIPCLLIGLLVTLVGSACWAWQSPVSTVAICGALLLPLALLARRLTPVNVHDWTESLDLSSAVAFFIGILFLFLAIGRFIFSKLARDQK